MSTWHDIKTAPKYRRIIIATDKEMYVVRWAQNFLTGHGAWLVARFKDESNGNDQIIIERSIAKAWTEAPAHPGKI